MAERGTILAVDIGTSATKAVLFDGSGRVLTLHRESYPVFTPRADWAEQDPETVYAAVVKAIRRAVDTRPAAIGIDAVCFSSQWYSVMPVGADDRPRARYLTWSDRRSAAEAERLRKAPGAEQLYQATGCPLDAIYPLSKIIWLKTQDGPRGARRFISIKEYVLRRLIGEYVVDWSVASASGLFDMRRRVWSAEALEAAGITERELSPTVPPKTIFRRWTHEALTATGIPQGTPCVIGAGDGVLASVGAGAVGEGMAAVNVGTSAACRYLVRSPIVDAKGRLWTYAFDENWWVIGGIVSSGGIVYDWFVRQVVGDPSGSGNADGVHETLNALAAGIAPGAEGLLFLPYLSGEQCPVWDPETTGAFLGLTLRHGRGHMARAVFEGIALSLARVIEALADAAGAMREIRLTGGLIGSSTWLQIAADMWGTRLHVPPSVEGSALGAAVLAWIALGMAPGYEMSAGLHTAARTVEPDGMRHQQYREQLRRADRLLSAIKSV